MSDGSTFEFPVNEWPFVVQVSPTAGDPARDIGADSSFCKVRRHRDGRVLIYAGNGEEGRRAGELIVPDPSATLAEQRAKIASTIVRVCDDGGVSAGQRRWLLTKFYRKTGGRPK